MPKGHAYEASAALQNRVVDPGRPYLHSARPPTTTISMLPVPLRQAGSLMEDWLTEQGPAGRKNQKIIGDLKQTC